MKCFSFSNVHFVVWTYFLIIHIWLVHCRKLNYVSAAHIGFFFQRKERNNKFLFAVFQKQFFLLLLPHDSCVSFMRFSSSISIFVLIKLEHIFHGRDFGFTEWKKKTEWTAYEILWEKLLYWRKEVCRRMCEFSLYWLAEANKKRLKLSFECCLSPNNRIILARREI